MITIKRDSNCEMLCIEKDGVCIFEGNNWDFSTGANALARFLKQCGLEAEVQDYTYKD